MRTPERYIHSLGKLKPNETLGKVAEHEIQDINRTVHCIDRPTFSGAVGVLLKARYVLTKGIGSQPVTCGIMRFVEHLALASRIDVVAFSFPSYSRETIEAARQARQRGCPVITVTGKLTLPIAFHWTRVLAVQTENMLHTN